MEKKKKKKKNYYIFISLRRNISPQNLKMLANLISVHSKPVVLLFDNYHDYIIRHTSACEKLSKINRSLGLSRKLKHLQQWQEHSAGGLFTQVNVEVQV